MKSLSRSIGASLLVIFAAGVIALQPASAIEEDFLVNSQKNILTIFKLQTEDLPFTVGGSALSKPKVDQQIEVSAQIQNTREEHQPYTFIVQILDKDGYTVFISWVENHLGPGETVTPSSSWMPGKQGAYEVQVMIWDEIGGSPVPLAEKKVAGIEVTQ
jgi:hypothetical protein